jgi:hypothetical protein
MLTLALPKLLYNRELCLQLIKENHHKLMDILLLRIKLVVMGKAFQQLSWVYGPRNIFAHQLTKELLEHLHRF